MAELRFWNHRLTSTGVQQGDLLGPLLFSLVLMELIENMKIPDEYLWYLDDGTTFGP